MTTPLTDKSTLDEIRLRFDVDVERFSNLDTGQAATIDAPLAMELITEAALAVTPHLRRILDIGCGAGNNALRLAQAQGGNVDCDLCDVSRPMLERAKSRVSEVTTGNVRLFEGDFREIPFEESGYDVIIAAAVLHHLRDEADWKNAFQKIFRLLRPGGSFWVTDLVTHDTSGIHELMWQRYGNYLEELGGRGYRDEVFAYIDKEDSPRSLTFQMGLMRDAGFHAVDVLHKTSCFAAFGAVKKG